MATKLLYHFNNSLVDSSGNGNDLTGSVAYDSSGKFSQALILNTPLTKILPNSYVQGGYTLEFFLKPTTIDTGNLEIINITNNANTRLRITNGGDGARVNFNTWNTGNTIPLSGGDLNVYRHYAVTFDGSSTYKVYQDGILKFTASDSTPYDSTVSIKFAETQASLLILDEVRLSDSVIYTTNFTPPSAEFSGGSSVANKLAQITVGGLRVIQLDSSPVSSGFDAPIGSLAMTNEGGVGYMYQKVGSSTTSWQAVVSGTIDLSAYFKKDGSVVMTGALDHGGFKALNMANGTSANDGVNKSQLDSGLALKIDSSEKGVANGVATLGADGKLPSSQVPAIAIVDTFVVNSQSAMLALSTAEQGDVAVRSDLNKTFILVSGLPSVLGNWQELLTPTDSVLSVNGQTGSVVLTTTNISEGTNLYFTEARVLATQLAGLSLASGIAITNGDSVIVAFGKIQKQINDEISARQQVASDLANHLADASDAHDATAISFVDNGNFTGITDVQSAIYAIDAYISAHVIQDDGSVPMLANLNLNSNKIVNLADPTAMTDGANKQYVDAGGGVQSIADLSADTNITASKVGIALVSNASAKLILPQITNLPVGYGVTIANSTATSLTNGVYTNGGTQVTSFPMAHRGFFTLTNKSPETWAFTFVPLRLTSGYYFGSKILHGLLDPAIATDASTKAYTDAKVEDAILNGVLDKAPSQNAVFDALALKQDQSSLLNFLRLDGTNSMGASLNMNGNKIVNLLDPTLAQDGATKKYVDDQFVAQGSVWKAPILASDLNDASADLYFGSKSGDFNIHFYRNNEEFFSMTKASGIKKLSMSVNAIERTDANFAVAVPNHTLALVGSTIYQEANIIMKAPTVGGLPKAYEYEQLSEVSVLDADATKSITYSSNSSSSNRKFKVEIMLTSDQGDMVMEKDIHVNRAGTQILVQDSFTSKESGVSAIECSMSFASGILSANLSGMSSITTKKLIMKVREIAQLP
jgi:hypothetical protein